VLPAGTQLFAVIEGFEGLTSAAAVKKPDGANHQAFCFRWCRRDESNTRPSHYE
jgi:hypothetical protein